MKERNQSLDALRGFAILTMILSGSVAFGGVLPAWMYHAQVPPPLHKFNPSIPGITWVDLVFPFFLFSMGAAIPLSLLKLQKTNATFIKVFWVAARRYLLLTFFAFFSYHMRAWVIAENPTLIHYLLSVLGFVLICFQFYQYKGEKRKTLFVVLKIMAFAAAFLLLYLLPFNKGKGFQFDKIDIIILVLANMAFFGTITWWLTKTKPFLRIGLLAFVAAIFLGAKEAGSWNEMFFNYSPLPWVYKFYYLKYLFIILPGTIAGKWLIKYSAEKENELKLPGAKPLPAHSSFLLITTLAFVLIITNVALLFGRYMELNVGVTVGILAALYYRLKTHAPFNNLLKQFFNCGTFLLLLGLFFEAFEGGIKKDPSTYSYYFVTTGLAFFMLIGFYGLQAGKTGAIISNYLALNGRNPMVAYVAGNLLLTPLLHVTGAIQIFDAMNGNAWTGFVKGVLFTGIVSLITLFFTKRKWLWKT